MISAPQESFWQRQSYAVLVPWRLSLQVYIVYMGERHHGLRPELVQEAHHGMLAAVLGRLQSSSSSSSSPPSPPWLEHWLLRCGVVYCCLALCSEQAAMDAILYSYRHGFSGFAAVLTGGQAARLSGELAAFPAGHLAAVLGKPNFDFMFLYLSHSVFLVLFCWIEFFLSPRLAWSCAGCSESCS